MVRTHQVSRHHTRLIITAQMPMHGPCNGPFHGICEVLVDRVYIAAGGGTAHGQTSKDVYPTRPVRMIVAFGAGGPGDIFARLIGQKLSEQLAVQELVALVRAGKLIISPSRAPAHRRTVNR